ncbi:MAG: hypothetical protein ACLP7P_03390 [Rhodomicrobium sp.]
MRRGRYTVLGDGLGERRRPEESEAQYTYREGYAFSDSYGDTNSVAFSAAILGCIAGEVAAFFASRKTFYVGGPGKYLQIKVSLQLLSVDAPARRSLAPVLLLRRGPVF